MLQLNMFSLSLTTVEILILLYTSLSLETTTLYNMLEDMENFFEI